MISSEIFLVSLRLTATAKHGPWDEQEPDDVQIGCQSSTTQQDVKSDLEQFEQFIAIKRKSKPSLRRSGVRVNLWEKDIHQEKLQKHHGGGPQWPGERRRNDAAT